MRTIYTTMSGVWKILEIVANADISPDVKNEIDVTLHQLGIPKSSPMPTSQGFNLRVKEMITLRYAY